MPLSAAYFALDMLMLRSAQPRILKKIEECGSDDESRGMMPSPVSPLKVTDKPDEVEAKLK